MSKLLTALALFGMFAQEEDNTAKAPNDSTTPIA
jgi:hypothetical protein